MKQIILVSLCLSMFAACGDDVENPDEENQEEVITTVTLTFGEGGNDIVASFRDADGPGGNAPTTDAVTLAADTTYQLDLTLLNETLPMDDEEYVIGNEIKEEAEEHQLFFTGTILDAGATHAYDDVESDYTENNAGDDLPVGMKNTFTTGAAGTGSLIVTLKHQPPVNDVETKSASSGINDGETDIEVEFDVTVE